VLLLCPICGREIGTSEPLAVSNGTELWETTLPERERDPRRGDHEVVMHGRCVQDLLIPSGPAQARQPPELTPPGTGAPAS
jgi:hypothetical protein